MGNALKHLFSNKQILDFWVTVGKYIITSYWPRYYAEILLFLDIVNEFHINKRLITLQRQSL